MGEVESFLAKQGLNASVIVDGAKKATEAASDTLTSAKPALESTASTLTSTNPVVIGEYVLGLLALYYLVRTASPHLAHFVLLFEPMLLHVLGACHWEAMSRGHAVPCSSATCLRGMRTTRQIPKSWLHEEAVAEASKGLTCLHHIPRAQAL